MLVPLFAIMHVKYKSDSIQILQNKSKLKTLAIWCHVISSGLNIGMIYKVREKCVHMENTGFFTQNPFFAFILLVKQSMKKQTISRSKSSTCLGFLLSRLVRMSTFSYFHPFLQYGNYSFGIRCFSSVGTLCTCKVNLALASINFLPYHSYRK